MTHVLVTLNLHKRSFIYPLSQTSSFFFSPGAVAWFRFFTREEFERRSIPLILSVPPELRSPRYVTNTTNPSVIGLANSQGQSLLPPSLHPHSGGPNSGIGQAGYGGQQLHPVTGYGYDGVLPMEAGLDDLDSDVDMQQPSSDAADDEADAGYGAEVEVDGEYDQDDDLDHDDDDDDVDEEVDDMDEDVEVDDSDMDETDEDGDDVDVEDDGDGFVGLGPPGLAGWMDAAEVNALADDVPGAAENIFALMMNGMMEAGAQEVGAGWGKGLGGGRRKMAARSQASVGQCGTARGWCEDLEWLVLKSGCFSFCCYISFLTSPITVFPCFLTSGPSDFTAFFRRVANRRHYDFKAHVRLHPGGVYVCE